MQVDVKITTNYFRRKSGQSLPLLKDGVDVFPNFDSSWKQILQKIYQTTSDKKLGTGQKVQMWCLENTWPTPYVWYKTEWPPP